VTSRSPRPANASPTLPALLRRVAGLQFNELEDGCVVYTPDRQSVHHLNATAAFVLELCNERNSVDEIVDVVRNAYGLRRRPATEVHRILEDMLDQGLLEPVSPSQGAGRKPARRG
jgi:hypothetical protein